MGTLLLVVMGAISYVFVERGLAHTHQLTADDLQPVEGAVAGQPAVLRGRTSRVHQHRHKVAIDPTGQGRVEMEQGHWHALTVREGRRQDDLSTRPGRRACCWPACPSTASSRSATATGQPAEKGINVGDEWTYRSFIEGGTLAAAVWTFEGITEDAFPNGLPVEMTIEVFRTLQGRHREGRAGQPDACGIPQTGKKVEVRDLRVEGVRRPTSQIIPRELQTPDGKKLDLFKDLVGDGQVEIWLQCVEPQQYFGAAQADMYLRARDASFALNFAKGYLGIWLQMLLVIALGVMFSTFLSGPVAMLATLGALLGGFFNDFMFRLATGQTYGGGPFESLIRLLTQQNVTAEMEPGLRTTVAQTLDQAGRGRPAG